MKCNESDMNIYYKVIFENIYLTYISWSLSPLSIIYSISIVIILMMLWWHDMTIIKKKMMKKWDDENDE